MQNQPHQPKNASVIDYRMATGMEALVGWLFLRQEYNRLVYLISQGLEKLGRMPDPEKKEIRHEIRRTSIEGRNAVLEAFRSGKTIDKLFVLDGCQDGPVRTILREARKYDTIINYVPKERLDQISETGKHQGVIAYAAAYEYAEVEDMLKAAEEKGRAALPHTVRRHRGSPQPGSHHSYSQPGRGPRRHYSQTRAVGLTATVAKTSAGALNYTPVAKVTNLTATMEDLKKKGMWFVCADMGGELMYKMNLKGSIGLVVGNEGEGVGKLVREHCDMVASIPMKGDIDSLNASVAAGVLAYEIVRQRLEM